MSLLNKATIITTPTAHSNGTLHSIKGGTVADFDVVRGSLATRVNAEGLIEDISILSGELVTDGSFTAEGVEQITNGSFDTDTNWTLGTGWSISDGKITKSGTDLSYLTHPSLTSVVGKTYRVRASITNVTTGNIRLDNFTSGTTYTSDIEIDETHTATTSGAFRFLGWAGFDGSIDNVSVVEVAADWTLSSGASVGEDKLDINANAYDYFASQLSVSTIGNTYKVSVDVEIDSGRMILYLADTNAFEVIDTSGSYTFYIVADGTQIRFRAFDTALVGSITNISVVEVIDATNIPRIDYTTGEGVVLLEPQSTNLITYSEDFSNAYWTKGGVSATGGFTSPSGDLNAYRLTEDTSSGQHKADPSSISVVSGIDYTCSVFVKKDSRDVLQMVWSGSFGSAYVNFDLTNGTIQASGLAIGEIKSFSNDWYRCSITQEAAASGLGRCQILLQDSISATRFGSYTGDGTSGIYIWGAQAEALPYATSYIPTSGAIATRLADLVTGAGDATTFNSTEGVLYVEMAALADDGTSRRITISNGTASKIVMVSFNDTDNQYRAYVINGGLVFDHTGSFVSLDFNKIALRFKDNDFALYVNGSKVATDLSGASPIGLNRLDFDGVNGALPFQGKVKALAVFNEALTDSELECLTTI